MLEAVIRFLISVAVVVLCVVLFVWVLGMLGIVLPSMVVKVLYVIAVLVCILFLVRLLRPYWGSWV